MRKKGGQRKNKRHLKMVVTDKENARVIMNRRKEKSMQEHVAAESSPELLTIPQVAQYLGVCRVHVYKLINNGLPVIRLGRVVRIHMTSLQRWLEEQEEITHL
jgi:excisionase family DNA binding protein